MDILEKLLHYRIINTKRFHQVASALAKTQELVAGWELDIKSEFNSTVDTKDPRYSNAEKRKVELAKTMANDDELQRGYKLITDSEQKVDALEVEEKVLKLKERYLFKELELFMAENQFLSDFVTLRDQINDGCWECGKKIEKNGKDHSDFCSTECCDKYNNDQAAMEFAEESL